MNYSAFYGIAALSIGAFSVSWYLIGRHLQKQKAAKPIISARPSRELAESALTVLVKSTAVGSMYATAAKRGNGDVAKQFERLVLKPYAYSEACEAVIATSRKEIEEAEAKLDRAKVEASVPEIKYFRIGKIEFWEILVAAVLSLWPALALYEFTENLLMGLFLWIPLTVFALLVRVMVARVVTLTLGRLGIMQTILWGLLAGVMIVSLVGVEVAFVTQALERHALNSGTTLSDAAKGTNYLISMVVAIVPVALAIVQGMLAADCLRRIGARGDSAKMDRLSRKAATLHEQIDSLKTRILRFEAAHDKYSKLAEEAHELFYEGSEAFANEVPADIKQGVQWSGKLTLTMPDIDFGADAKGSVFIADE